MQEFKFLSPPIIKAHDGGYIYTNQIFYSMNKHEIKSMISEHSYTEKYTIVTRLIEEKHRDKFKPDYEALWYFRSKMNAIYLRGIWKKQDEDATI